MSESPNFQLSMNSDFWRNPRKFKKEKRMAPLVILIPLLLNLNGNLNLFKFVQWLTYQAIICDSELGIQTRKHIHGNRWTTHRVHRQSPPSINQSINKELSAQSICIRSWRDQTASLHWTQNNSCVGEKIIDIYGPTILDHGVSSDVLFVYACRFYS